MPYTSAISMPSPPAPPVTTMTSSLRSTSRGRPNAMRWLMALAIHASVTMPAQTKDATIGGDSHL